MGWKTLYITLTVLQFTLSKLGLPNWFEEQISSWFESRSMQTQLCVWLGISARENVSYTMYLQNLRAKPPVPMSVQISCLWELIFSSSYSPTNHVFISASLTSCKNVFFMHHVLVISIGFVTAWTSCLYFRAVSEAPVMMTIVWRHSVVYFVRT